MLARRIAAEEALALAEQKQEEQKKNIQSLFDNFWFDQQTEVPEINLARSDPAEQEEIDQIIARLDNYHHFIKGSPGTKTIEGWDARLFDSIVTHTQMNEPRSSDGTVDPVLVILWLQDCGLVPCTETMLELNNMSDLIDCVRSLLSTQVDRDSTCADQSPITVFELWQQQLPMLADGSRGGRPPRRLADAEREVSTSDGGAARSSNTRGNVGHQRTGARVAERPLRLDPRLQRRNVQRPGCLLYTSPSPRDGLLSRMPSSA